MRTLNQLLDRLEMHGRAEYVCDPNVGYLAWHRATGDNIEMLFIEVKEKGKGQGLELYRRFVRRVQASDQPVPYACFGFQLGGNEAAWNFYEKMNWTLLRLPDPCLYHSDSTTMMWIRWTDLVEQLFPIEAMG